MDRDELIKEALIRYPIGTVFKEASGTSNDDYILDKIDLIDTNRWISIDHIIVYCKGVTGCGKYIYHKGVWAEIISVPEKEIINNYQIF